MAAQAGLCLAWSETPKDTFCLNSGWMRIAVRGAKRPSIRTGKRSKVREKSVKSGEFEMKIEWQPCVKIFRSYAFCKFGHFKHVSKMCLKLSELGA